MNYLEKNKNNVYSFKKDYKEVIRNNKVTLKIQQIFKSERQYFY